MLTKKEVQHTCCNIPGSEAYIFAITSCLKRKKKKSEEILITSIIRMTSKHCYANMSSRDGERCTRSTYMTCMSQTD